MPQPLPLADVPLADVSTAQPGTGSGLPAEQPPAPPVEVDLRRPRIRAIDWLRGLVMVLMTIDHASESYNRGRFVTDTVAAWTPGRELPPAQFLTRWITHLCAPTFVLLAGLALALSTGRRPRNPGSGISATRFLLSRGLFIVLLDPLWVSRFWFPSGVLFQVMFAIGASTMCLSLLQRPAPVPAPTHALRRGPVLFAGLGLAGLFALELWRALPPAPGSVLQILTSLLLSGGRLAPWFFVAYPLVPWLSVMLLGYGLGCAWRAPESGLAQRPVRWLGGLGLLALVLFAVLRGLNGYGNMGLLRDSLAPLQWLHVSKYPPSVTFVALELGIALALLALLVRIDQGTGRVAQGLARALEPLRTLGSTALFFYVLHIPLLHLSSYALGLHRKCGLGATYLATAVTVAVLYPACRFYGRYKAQHPYGLTRYL